MKTLKCDLNKAIINIGFIGAAFTAMLLCFTADAYMDPKTSKVYTVFEAMFTLDKKIIKTDSSLASVYMYSKCLTGYITMFIPILVAFPFMVTFCAERNSGLMRFTITRTGKIKYCLSKFFACSASAGLAVMLGVAMYCIVVKLYFPDLSSYSIDPELLDSLSKISALQVVLKTLSAAFLYGAVSSMPAFLLSSFCKNPYLITCVPFLLTYIWRTALDKVSISFVASNQWEMLDKLAPYYPDSVTNGVLYSYNDSSIGRTIVLFNILYVLVLLVSFIIIMNARKDKGV